MTESMNELCRRTSLISRARNTENSTSTVMIVTKERIPTTISQALLSQLWVRTWLR